MESYGETRDAAALILTSTPDGCSLRPRPLETSDRLPPAGLSVRVCAASKTRVNDVENGMSLALVEIESQYVVEGAFFEIIQSGFNQSSSKFNCMSVVL
jgi:hypothetical protein